MSRYQNGAIYKIVCNNPEITDCYVGSCCNFNKRKYGHKSSCHNEKKSEYNFRVYQFIRENGGWTNWSMIQIEPFPCNTKRELETRERHHLEQLKANLNCRVPTRTPEEYREGHKDHKREYDKHYRDDNQEKLLKRVKQYYSKNKNEINERRNQIIECECGNTPTKRNISSHIKGRKHQYYEKIRDYILE